MQETMYLDTSADIDREYMYEEGYVVGMQLREISTSLNKTCIGIEYHGDHTKRDNILLLINDHYAVEDELEDVEVYLNMLLEADIPITFKLLDTSLCSIERYLKRHPPKKKIKSDLYGFSRSDEYIQADKDFSKAQAQISIQRDLDWVEYLNSIGGADNLKANNIFKSPPELKLLVRRGIPIAYRAVIWSKLSLSSAYKSFYPHDYYTSLQKRQYEIPKKVADEIEKDLDRTFPQHEFFTRDGRGEDTLRRVLRAFALHKKDIGYCQSLNFVAAFMLLLMNEEDTFWLLVTLTDTVLPPDYYTSSMIGSNADHFVFCELLRTRLPRIHKFLVGNSLEFPLVTLQWFMCLFVNTLRPEVTLRVWDMLFNEGSKVLFRIGIALLKMHEKEICSYAVKDSGDLLILLNNMGKGIVDADALIAFAYKSFSHAKIKSPIFTSTWNSNRVSRSNSTADMRGLGVAHKGVMPPTTSGTASPIESQRVGNASPTSQLEPEPGWAGTRDSASPVELGDKLVEDDNSTFFSFPQLPSFRLPQLSSSNEYRNFKRVEIESLRFRFRQQVFEEISATTAAREEWREKQLLDVTR